ncbi:MAG TPA: DUF1573 domain-containing protein [Chitinophagaceae bacterium]|nr:DUF1573 domain-containing protein [Chitinophagaceae bacterium]
MNATIKTILLTILTLSVFAIALVELSGVSSTALFNAFKSDPSKEAQQLTKDDQQKRDEAVKKLPHTTMDVPETKFLFGKMKEGDKVRHTWLVKNTGNHPLMISNVQTSCGCTAPFFPKEPILPGKEGEITLEFNSAGKEGHVLKNALIIANTDNSPFSIGFEAEVEKK